MFEATAFAVAILWEICKVRLQFKNFPYRINRKSGYLKNTLDGSGAFEGKTSADHTPTHPHGTYIFIGIRKHL
jgi:hypothetical protein